MEKRIEVKPKFLLVTDDHGSVTTREFEEEKHLRQQALEDAEAGNNVTAYRITGRANVSSYPALNLRWK